MKNFYKNPKPAILIIDMLNAYFKEESVLGKRKNILVNNINQIVDFAHVSKIPVIWIRQEYEKDLSDAPLSNKKNNKLPNTLKGEYGSQILDELHLKSTDKIVIKKDIALFMKQILMNF